MYQEKDWATYPKFRHNLWTNFADEPDVAYLTVSHGKYRVPNTEATEFLRMRGFCTGHHDIEQISDRSGVPLDRAREIVQSLADAEILRRPHRPFAELGEDEIREVLLSAVAIWSEQLRETHISVEVFDGAVSRRVAFGWLLETYHYIRSFPYALEVAAKSASGELRAVLVDYAEQERGHEMFVEQSLVRLGLSADEVRHSIPLVTTRLIDLLMRELFEATPCVALLLAGIVEADDFQEEEIPGLQRRFAQHYAAPLDALEPFFRHSRIDSDLGHGKLPTRYSRLLTFRNDFELNNVVNRLHDIKHAFDAQKLEIKEYYSREGNYFPRQPVDFFAI